MQHSWPKRRCFWHFNSARWEDIRQYYSDFPWDDYCFHVRDPFLCAERITEVIIPGMELYIPHTFSNNKGKKTWFNSACSRAVKDREAAHKQYRRTRSHLSTFRRLNSTATLFHLPPESLDLCSAQPCSPMTMEEVDIDVELLFSLVQNQPVLWDIR